MRGYLNPEANRKFAAAGGWYDTGDIVKIDDQGFIHILGRMKRFAKISGEMVSLTAVEDALAGRFPQYGQRLEMAILARPDADRGEVLWLVSNEPKLQIEEIRKVIRESGLSNLCVPREVRVVKEVHKLGSGKVDYRALETSIKS
jgi:acyl-[acyl-carrier-protein]-phospholipid O-acyltransferase/long-chain-fatty-acid--[acyl-carrier-protein] ligase